MPSTVHTHARRVDAFCWPTVIPLRDSNKSVCGFLYLAPYKRRKINVAVTTMYFDVCVIDGDEWTWRIFLQLVKRLMT